MEEPDRPPPEIKGMLKKGRTFTPWKTIVIGELKNSDELIDALERDDYRVTKEAKSVLRDPTSEFISVPTEVDLVCLDVSDIGLPMGASHTTVCRVLQKLGLQLATAQIAAEARRNFDEQEDDEYWYVYVAMKPIEVDGNPYILDLYFDDQDESGELAIYADDPNQSRFNSASRRYLCVLPK